MSKKLWQKIKITLICLWLIFILQNLVILHISASKPLDAFLVLGGSIQREIHVAELAIKYPKIPILIATGSPDPCILVIFQRAQAPIDQVWLENCSYTTFTNYYFTAPILKRWGVHHVKLITSLSHTPRAKLLGQIILGSQGIWVDFDLIKESIIPGNTESNIKTILDVTRAILWSLVAPFISPKCQRLKPLSDVNLTNWCHRGFRCEHQGNINPKSVCSILFQ